MRPVHRALTSEALLPPAGFQNESPNVVANIIFVGGNSQHCAGNDEQLLHIWRPVTEDIARRLLNAEHPNIDRIGRHYFSWVGDTFNPNKESCIPNLFGNVWRGETPIRSELERRQLLDQNKALIFVGFSNGAATAFDVVADLCPTHRVSLLVTLDPVSRLAGRRERLGTEHWLHVYIPRHDFIIFAGGPWRGNAPESRLNRMVMPNETGHGDVENMWRAVASSTEFEQWATEERARLFPVSAQPSRAPEPSRNCPDIGPRWATLGGYRP